MRKPVNGIGRTQPPLEQLATRLWVGAAGTLDQFQAHPDDAQRRAEVMGHHVHHIFLFHADALSFGPGLLLLAKFPLQIQRQDAVFKLGDRLDFYPLPCDGNTFDGFRPGLERRAGMETAVVAIVSHPNPRIIGITALPFNPIIRNSRFNRTARRGR